MFFESNKDKQIIELIKSANKQDEAKAIKLLIKQCKQRVIGYLRKQGEKDDDQLNDLFYDAVVVLMEKARRGEFQLESIICTYLTGVAKNQWMDLITRRVKLAELKKEYPEAMESNNSAIDVDKEKMTFLINKLTANCLNLLDAYYFKNISFIAYAENNNLEPANVRKRHGRCLDALRVLWNE